MFSKQEKNETNDNEDQEEEEEEDRSVLMSTHYETMGNEDFGLRIPNEASDWHGEYDFFFFDSVCVCVCVAHEWSVNNLHLSQTRRCA